MKDWVQLIILAIATLIAFGLAGWYVFYIWSDCLAENSFLTCMRMLR